MERAGQRRLGFLRQASPRVGHVTEDARRMPVELMALVCDREPSPVAIEEHDTEIALEVLDCVGHRRLRDREVLRRARNRLRLARGDEVLELAESEYQV